MNELFGLDGKVAVITGVLGKLGYTWADTLLDAGALVFGIDKDGATASNEFNELIKKYGEDRITLFHIDITERVQVEKALSECTKKFGIPKILVNNAGIDQPPGNVKSYRVDEIPADVFMKTVNVNLFGTFLMTQVFGGIMEKQARGSIINIGSLYAGVSPDMHFYDHIQCDPPFLKPPAYGASKAAVVNITKYFATHWGKSGVRVNTLSPGGVLGGQDEEFKKKFCARVPLARMALMNDLKGPLIFLASDASSYVTGTELKVDGGYTAW